MSEQFSKNHWRRSEKRSENPRAPGPPMKALLLAEWLLATSKLKVLENNMFLGKTDHCTLFHIA